MSWIRRIGASVAGLLLVLCATARPGAAQTWQWASLTHPAFGPPLRAQATVALTASEVSFSYTTSAPADANPGANRRIVIASCRAALRDVARASAMRTGGRVFFLLELKPQRLADCDSGKKAIAALPGEDFQQVSRIAAAVNRACCSPGAAMAAARPSPRPASPNPRLAGPSPRPSSATPRPPGPSAEASSPPPSERSPGPSPSAPPSTPSAAAARGHVGVTDWVETEGLFAFVRVHNTGGHRVTISNGAVLNCKNLDVGCGPFARQPVIAAHTTVTVTTVATTDQQHLPSFTYAYTAASEDGTVSRYGSSKKVRPVRLPRISPQESRAGEALAIGRLRGAENAASPNPVPVPTDVPARLVTRGSTRLAIGESGVARVRVLVGVNGAPQEATIVSISNRRLRAAAIEVAVSSTYAAATKNGQPIASDYIATFSFSGQDPANASVPVWRRSPLPSALPSPTPLPSPSPSATPEATPEPSPTPDTGPRRGGSTPAARAGAHRPNR